MTTAVTPDGVRALLADGRVVRFRLITPSDADTVLAIHMRLSEYDRYLRFFGSGTRVLDTITRRITRALVVVRADGCQVLDARVRLVPREPADPFLRRLRA